MLVQVYSDLHIEFHKEFPLIKKEAPILILAGDIGKISHIPYRNFLEYISKNWETIIYVYGNHEFYHSKKTITQLKDEYNNYIKYNYKNIYVLDNDYFYINNYLFIGSIFWSYYKPEYPDNIINCVKKIKIKNNDNWNVSIGREKYNNLHLIDKHFIFNILSSIKVTNANLIDNIQPGALNINEKTKIILLTHYPLYNKFVSNPIYNSKYNDLFQNNIIEQLKMLQKNYFPNNELINIAGHTHYSYDFYHGNIRFISNQLGYSEEYKQNISKFEPTGLFYL